MATNPYFLDQYISPLEDQSLAEDLIVESIQIKGIDHYYLPRTLTNFDEFFGEDQASAFSSAIPVEMYLENVNSWQDDGSFLSKFGLEIRDSAKLAVSIKRFNETVTSQFPNITRPREGDIVALPSPIDHRMRFFEISFVTNEEPFYQLGKLYLYSITVKNFEYNGEKFETGIPSFDKYTTDNSLVVDITIGAGTGTYTIGEKVSQITGWSASVISSTSTVLSVTNTSGEFDNISPILGDISNASHIPNNPTANAHVSGLGLAVVNNDAMINDNTTLDSKIVVDGIVDFSESNPFSE